MGIAGETERKPRNPGGTHHPFMWFWALTLTPDWAKERTVRSSPEQAASLSVSSRVSMAGYGADTDHSMMSACPAPVGRCVCMYGSVRVLACK